MNKHYKNSLLLGIVFLLILIPAFLVFKLFNSENPDLSQKKYFHKKIKTDSLKAATKKGIITLYHFPGSAYFDINGNTYDTFQFIKVDSSTLSE